MEHLESHPSCWVTVWWCLWGVGVGVVWVWCGLWWGVVCGCGCGCVGVCVCVCCVCLCVCVGACLWALFKQLLWASVTHVEDFTHSTAPDNKDQTHTQHHYQRTMSLSLFCQPSLILFPHLHIESFQVEHMLLFIAPSTPRSIQFKCFGQFNVLYCHDCTFVIQKQRVVVLTKKINQCYIYIYIYIYTVYRAFLLKFFVIWNIRTFIIIRNVSWNV